MSEYKHRVKRAIVMAAGFGSRMMPVTKELPKPLVKVNGKRMIETVIDGLHKNGIYEIHIVTGYLKECFEVLKNKYSDLDIIENPYYDTCNNISSLYVAREYIEDAIIIDGDQIIYNSEILRPEFNKSGYNCVWQEENTNEWMLTVENGTVVSCSRNGGSRAWQLYGISRWTKEDGHRLKKHIEEEFEIKKNTSIYWDDVAIFCYPDEYELGIFEMKYGDVIEVDNLDELIMLDASYRDMYDKE